MRQEKDTRNETKLQPEGGNLMKVLHVIADSGSGCVLNVQSLHCRDALEEKLLLDVTGMEKKKKRRTVLFLVLCGTFEK
jgi:hypothetical protein